jgi:2,4-dienoyl-CoA reductase-like NADH-dependent reductase (Old Yellow Enzyme family)
MKRLELLKPFRIGTMAIRNRLVCAQQECYFGADGEPFDWAEQARGAFGLCLLEAGSVHRSSGIAPALFGDTAPRLVQSIVRSLESDDTRVIQRLTHGGHLVPSFDGRPPWGVSSRPGPTGRAAKAMTPEEILELRLSFVSSALMCQEWGLDGVEVTVCSGNLMQQFLSPACNDRTDHYGGSYANRSRFLFETLRAVRAAVGPDFVVGIGLGRDPSLPDASGQMASVLLDHLDSEKLVDYIEHFEPAAARPSGTVTLPRVLTTDCRSLDDAAGIIASGRADLVGFIAGPHRPEA